MILRVILLSFSFLLLAAHFSRIGMTAMSIISLLIPFLLFIKKRWVLIFIQVACYTAALEWVRTIFSYIKIREEYGEAWGRLAIILGAVALVTALSGVLLNFGKIKEKYG